MPDQAYDVPKDAKSFARYGIHVWELHDGTWVAQPDQWPLLEARSHSRDVAIIGCIDMIRAECEQHVASDLAITPELRRYDEPSTASATSSEAMMLRTWRPLDPQ